MELATLFGYMGTVTGTTCLLPQVYKSWKTKGVEDISWGMLLLLLVNAVFWFMSGLFQISVPLLLTNGFVFFVMLLLITFKIRYRNHL